MENEKSMARKTEAIRLMYRNEGVHLSDHEAKGLVEHLGNKPFRAAIFCIAIIVALVAFLIVRFAL